MLSTIISHPNPKQANNFTVAHKIDPPFLRHRLFTNKHPTANASKPVHQLATPIKLLGLQFRPALHPELSHEGLTRQTQPDLRRAPIPAVKHPKYGVADGGTEEGKYAVEGGI